MEYPQRKLVKSCGVSAAKPTDTPSIISQLLCFVYVVVFGVVNIVGGSAFISAGICALSSLSVLSRLIYLFGYGVNLFLELFLLSLDGFDILFLDLSLKCVYAAADIGLFLVGKLVAHIGKHFFGGVNHLVGAVYDVNLFAALFILGGILLGFLNGLFDVVLGHIGVGGDSNRLFLAGTEVFCGYVNDTVGVDVEGYLNLRDSAGCRSDTVEVEYA